MPTRLSLSLATVGAVAIPLMCGTPAQAQATRTWVSGVGDDVNPCSRTAPCKTWAGAISKTATGGYIDCLDPGGFGAVTITKSITIQCDEEIGHAVVAGTNAIVVNAPGGSAVTLRGLSLEGIFGGGANSGVNGINFIGQGSLTVQEMIIHDFNQNGINFTPSGGGTSTLNVSDETLIFNNGGANTTPAGIMVAPSGGTKAIVFIDGVHVDTNANGVIVNGAGGAADVVMRNSVASRNTGFGVQVTSTGSRATALIDRSSLSFNAGTGFNLTGNQAFGWIGDSTVTGNGTGVSSTGTLLSFKNNQIINNTPDGTPINPTPGPLQ